MIRTLIFIPLTLLAACGNDSAPFAPKNAAPEAGTYAGAGRDRLCVGPGQDSFGVIVYGEGDMNCSARGRIDEGDGEKSLALVPRGEGAGGCTVPVALDGNTIRLGKPSAACAYYCAPGATLDGKTFTKGSDTPVTDFGGEKLC